MLVVVFVGADLSSLLAPSSISCLISLVASLNSRIPFPKPRAISGIFFAPKNITTNIELTAQYSHTFGSKISQIKKGSSLVTGKNNGEQLLVNSSKIPSNNEVLVGVNYYFNM